MVRLRKKLSFNDVYNVLGASYKSLSARAIAVKVNNEWTNSMIVLSLTMRDESSLSLDQRVEMEKFEKLGILRTPNLKVLQEVLKADILPTLINQILRGGLTMGNYSIRLRDGYDRTEVESEGYAIRYGEYGEYTTLGYYVYSNDAVSSLLHKLNIEDELLSLGLKADELGVEWLKVKGFNLLSINVILILPIYIRMLDLRYLGNGKVNLRLKAHKALTDNFNLILTLKRYDHTSETYLPLDYLSGKLNSFSSKEEGDLAYIDVYYEFKVPPGEADRVDVKIVNEPIGIVIEHSPLVRDIFSYKTFEDIFVHTSTRFINLEDLGEYLINPVSKVGPSKASNAFERAIAWLLSLLGFKVVELGDLGLGVLREDKYEVGEADIVVQDAITGKIYVVSCSLKPPRPDKVDKIANISGYFKERGVMVEPLMFVSESAGEVKRSVRRAKLLDRDTIIQIVGLVRKERFEEAKRIIEEPVT